MLPFSEWCFQSLFRARELNSPALEVNNRAAVIFNRANQFDRCLGACEKMYRIDANSLPAHQDLAEAYLERSRFDDAIEVLRKAIAISRGAATARGRLSFAYS